MRYVSFPSTWSFLIAIANSVRPALRTPGGCRVISAVTILGLLGIGSSAVAGTAAAWSDAQLNANGSVTAATGSGTLSRGSAISYSSAANTYESKNWTAAEQGSPSFGNYYVQITANCTGHSNIVLYFTDARNNNGPTQAKVYYSTTGTAGPYTLASGPWTVSTASAARIVNLSAVSALNNNPNVVFRIHAWNRSNSAGTYALSGITVRSQTPPTLTTNAGATVAEGASVTLSSSVLLVSDAEEAPSQLTYTLGSAPANGTLQRNSVSLANGSAFTQADINAGLVTYRHSGSETTSDAFTFTVSDGAGGTLSARTFSITVTPGNDAPSISAGAQSCPEDTTATLAGNIVITDPDAGAGLVQVGLQVGNGRIFLLSTAGVTAGGNGTSSVALTGTLSALNAVLAAGNVTYRAGSNFAGADTLSVSADDQGNTGSGGARTASGSATISVSAVNDGPQISVPGSQVTDEDSAIVFTGANGVSASDPDAAGANIRVTVTAGNGRLAPGSTAGVTVLGANTASLSLTGVQSSVNSALNGLSYTPNTHFTGTDLLTFAVSDLGNTGAGGALADSRSVEVGVNPINDAPGITVPAAQVINEDTTFTFSGASAITLSDVDSAAGLLQLTLAVSNGRLLVASTAGLSLSGNGSETVSALGNLTDLAAAISGLQYVPNGEYSGADALAIWLDDQGNAGAGGALSAFQTLGMTVAPVNDAPVVSAPATVQATEDTALFLSESNAPSVADVDAGGGDIQVLVSSTGGRVTPAPSPGVTVSGSGTRNLTLTGPVANVNLALNGLKYQPNADYAGTGTITITANDQGNTGGAAATAEKVITIPVQGVNDGPSLELPTTVTLLRGTSGLVSGITITDIDSGGNSIEVALAVTSGTLSLGTTGSLTFSAGANGSSGFVIQGPLAAVNAALATLQYHTPGSETGTDHLSVSVSDLGSTGQGGALSVSGGVPLNIVLVNLVFVSADIAGGNQDGIIQPDECNELYVTMRNTGETTGSIINGTIYSNTPGVYVTQNFALYPEIPTGNVGANITPFMISTTNQFVCGTPINLTLIATASTGDTSAFPVELSSGVARLDRFDNNVPVNTKDMGGSESPLQVTGVTGTVTSVTVSVYATHDRIGDLRVQLIAPDNTKVSLANRRGGNGSSFGTAASPDSERTTFDATASTAISAGSAPFVGSFRPEGSLLVFRGWSGSRANGTWKLRVVDNKSGTTGIIHAWSLQITSRDCVQADGSCPGTPTADLTVTASASPDPVLNGTPLTYELAAANDGPDTAGLVTITNVLPDELDFVSCALSTGTVTVENRIVSMSFGTLEAAESATATLVLRPNTAGVITNTFGVSASVNDPNTLNNLAPVSTLVNPQADVRVEKFVSSSPAYIHAPLSYSVVVTNLGPDVSGLVTVSDPLPAGFNLSSATSTSGSCTVLEGVVTCIPGTLQDGDVTTVTLVGTPNAFGQLVNVASATVNDVDADLSNNTSTAEVTVVNAAPVLDLNGPEPGTDSTAHYVEGSGGMAVAPAGIIADSNDLTLTSMSVTLAGRLDGNEESLSADVAGTSIQQSYDAETGVLTLTGNDTPGRYQQVLRTISYLNSSDMPTVGERLISYSLCDPHEVTEGSSTITVEPVNDAPTLDLPPAQTIRHDTDLQMPAIAIADVDVGSGDVMTTLTAASGTLTLPATAPPFVVGGGNGSSMVVLQGKLPLINALLQGVVYRGNPGYIGSETIDVEVSDLGGSGSGGAKSSAGTIPMTVEVPVTLSGFGVE